MDASQSLHKTLRLALAVTLAVALGGCGGGAAYHDVGVAGGGPVLLLGAVEVDNLSFEFVDTFFLTPAATDLWTANLFLGPLPPDALVYVGDFEEDVYDAEADLELGDLVQWFDVPVPADDVTTFEVW